MVTVTSVNVGSAASIDVGGRPVTTGINKRPVQGPVAVDANGLAADAICNTQHHGGVDQAVYIYTAEDYAYWQAQLGRDLAPGTFGENLTVSGVDAADFKVGDRIILPGIELELTAPRIPCATFAARMGNKQFARAFVQAERPGVYARVLGTGSVSAGDRGEYRPYPGASITICAVLPGLVSQAGDRRNRTLPRTTDW